MKLFIKTNKKIFMFNTRQAFELAKIILANSGILFEVRKK